MDWDEDRASGPTDEHTVPLCVELALRHKNELVLAAQLRLQLLVLSEKLSGSLDLSV